MCIDSVYMYMCIDSVYMYMYIDSVHGVCIMLYIISLQGKKIEATPLAMYNYFIDRVRENLHVALAMSPIGDAFRNRLRMFPSLINCCTIDWFQVSILEKHM